VSARRGVASHAALAMVLVLAFPALARERVHTVAAGESASSLAKTYYDDPDLGDVLLRYNGRSSTVIHPGERLTIPSCAVHRIRPGDTWSGLAQRALGRANAAATLAELNGLAIESPLHVGESVVFPVVVKHTLVRGDTLASLAARYYGDDGKAPVLQEFGRIEDATRLSVGTVVEIPLICFRKKDAALVEPVATAPSPPPSSPAASGERPPAPPLPPPTPPRYAKPLAEARVSYSAGDYARAREVLESIRPAVAEDGTSDERREAARLLAFVYVAFDRDADACAAYLPARGASDGSDLDPDQVSPRIRNALAACPTAGKAAGPLDPTASGPQISSHADRQR
jgi:LysM repeat protein